MQPAAVRPVVAETWRTAHTGTDGFAALLAARTRGLCLARYLGRVGWLTPALTSHARQFSAAGQIEATCNCSCFSSLVSSSVSSLVFSFRVATEAAGSSRWRSAFLAIGVVGLFTALIVWVFVREPKRGGLDAPVRERMPA